MMLPSRRVNVKTLLLTVSGQVVAVTVLSSGGRLHHTPSHCPCCPPSHRSEVTGPSPCAAYTPAVRHPEPGTDWLAEVTHPTPHLTPSHPLPALQCQTRPSPLPKKGYELLPVKAKVKHQQLLTPPTSQRSLREEPLTSTESPTVTFAVVVE